MNQQNIAKGFVYSWLISIVTRQVFKTDKNKSSSYLEYAKKKIVTDY